jgi:NADH-quinone oxidoreductase subunit M
MFTPLVGSLVMMLLPGENKKVVRWVAFGFSLVPFLLTLVLWVNFPWRETGFHFEEQVPWFELLNSTYHLGVDGISLPMVLLTTFLTPLAILISFSIEERTKLYMALFLMLETGMLGVFVSLDLIIFFIFWEIGLVPMYFLINIWGSANRRYASFKFFIYTMAGSIGLLLSIQLIGLTMGTFDMPELFANWPAFGDDLFGVANGTIKAVGFWLFTIAFAIKVPVWPFHTWLPDAHTEAPTAGSMILAGVLLKLGAYGFLRLVLPLFPMQAAQYAPVLAVLAMLAIIMGAFASFGQSDFKRLVAYSSVNHMGFVVLAIAVAARSFNGSAGMQDAIIATNGAVLQMFNHGLSSAAMFLLVGVIYERTHTRDLTRYGGLWALAPVYGGILIFSSMASLGLPGLNGFVSEFLVVRGSWPVFTLITALSMLGLLFTGAYILKAVRDVLHGPLNEEWVEHDKEHALEINTREIAAVAPLMVLMLVIGLYPAWLLNRINVAVTNLLS